MNSVEQFRDDSVFGICCASAVLVCGPNFPLGLGDVEMRDKFCTEDSHLSLWQELHSISFL